MKSDKRVVFGILILGIVLVSIIAVSAAWTDIFKFGSDNKDLEGELASQQATASVKVQNLVDPPIVVYVSSVSGGAGVTFDSIKPFIKIVGDGNTSVLISFIAQQGGNVGNLASTSFSGVTFNKSGETSRSNVSCSNTQIASCPSSLCGNTAPAMNYSCKVSMMYFDGIGTWSVNATVVSATGAGSNLTENFPVETSTAAGVYGSVVNWTSALATTATNVLSNTNLTVENYGNVPYVNLIQVNATDLNGTTPGLTDKIIPALRFSANSCGGTQLGKDTNPNIIFTATKAISSDMPGGKNTTLPFCITSLPTIPSQDYSTTTRNWIITAP